MSVCMCVCVCARAGVCAPGLKVKEGKNNLSVTYYGILGTFLILNFILTTAL